MHAMIAEAGTGGEWPLTGRSTGRPSNRPRAAPTRLSGTGRLRYIRIPCPRKVSRETSWCMPAHERAPESSGGTHHVPPAVSRVELAGILLLTFLGFGLRLAWPSHLAVEHFDKGVYASNIFLPEYGFRFPQQHLYAPPLLPSLIESIFVFRGTSNLGAMLVSIIAGGLTVPLVWWTGRRWWGTSAGLAAASLAAFSDVHILFSRTALTDVLLSFWLVLSVALLAEAYASRSWWASICAGVVAGLAWWTKYNGWLPLTIGVAALAGACLDRTIRGEVRNRVVLWLITAGFAIALWLPWLLSLQDKGGTRPWRPIIAAISSGSQAGGTRWSRSGTT